MSIASPPATTVFTLATPLPEPGVAVAIVGFGITFDGVSQSPGAFLCGAVDFREFSIQIRAAQNATVDRVAIRGLSLITSRGVSATGNLAGTVVTGSSFFDSKAVPSQPNFAGTGIRAQGDCAGTVVQGNSFSGNNYGFAFMAARNLALRNNFFARNSIAGIYIEGDCSGSTKSGNTFATASGQRNRVNIPRTRTSRGA